MSSAEPDIRAMLLSAYPDPDAASFQDWAAVLGRAATENHRDQDTDALRAIEAIGHTPRVRRGARVWRGARRRPLLLVLAVVVLVVVPVSAVAGPKPWWSLLASTPIATQLGFGPAHGASVVLIREGSWDGERWALTGYRSVRDSLCTEFSFAGNGPLHGPASLKFSSGGGGCGPIAGKSTIQLAHERPSLDTIGLSIGGVPVGPGQIPLRYISGDVIPAARTVQIKLANGTVISTLTFKPPTALGLNVRFYAAELPATPLFPVGNGSHQQCLQRVAQAERVQPTQLTALNAAGRTIAQFPVEAGRALTRLCEAHRNTFTVPTNLPAAERKLTTVGAVTGPYGARASIAVGGTVEIQSGRNLPDGRTERFLAPSRCWRVSFSNGQSQGTCSPETKRRNPGLWLEIQHAGRDTFVIVQAEPRIGSQVTRITFQLQDGHVLTKTPIDGIAVFAIPRDDLTTRSQHGFVTLYHGRPVPIVIGYNGDPLTGASPILSTRQIVYYRSCPPGSKCYG